MKLRAYGAAIKGVLLVAKDVAKRVVVEDDDHRVDAVADRGRQLLGVEEEPAIAQAVGMGIFGTFNWIKRDRSAILSPVVFATVPIAAAATLLALFVFPVAEARPLQLTFSFFGIGLAAYIFIGLRAGLDRGTRRFRFSPFMVGALAAVGLLGGLSVGYIGVGVDALLFLVLTSLFRIDTHEATVTGIIAMGLTAMVPFGVHLLVTSSIPLDLWLMVLPGILLGARIGPWLNCVASAKCGPIRAVK